MNALSNRKLAVSVFFALGAAGFASGVVASERVRDIRMLFENTVWEAGISEDTRAWGGAWVDYDGDEWLDFALFAGRRGFRLYQNNKDGTFRDVTERSGIDPPEIFGVGGAFGDYDNDGCPDLYLALAVAEERRESRFDRLYQNNCDGTFKDVTAEAGILNGGYAQGVAWADYDHDGFLDVYVANRGSFDREGHVEESNVLWRNNGDGTFTDVTELAGVDGFSYSCADSPGVLWSSSSIKRPLRKTSFQPAWLDYDNDGFTDLFVATEEMPSPLYRNNGDGTFSEVTAEAELCLSSTNMGIAVGDYNNDGFQDLYATNEGANFFWRNNGNGTFMEIATEMKVEGRGSLGWGTEFFDYDNDGWLDLYVANGRVAEFDALLRFDKLYRNDLGLFSDVSLEQGVRGNEATHGVAVGDYDNNGFPDLFVTTDPFSFELSNRLYRNKGNGNNWLTLVLEGTRSNRDAVGARIVLSAGGNTQVREVRAGSSFMSQNSLWQTFGLKRHSEAERIEIYWPSGELTLLTNVPANQKMFILEGE